MTLQYACGAPTFFHPFVHRDVPFPLSASLARSLVSFSLYFPFFSVPVLLPPSFPPSFSPLFPPFLSPCLPLPLLLSLSLDVLFSRVVATNVGWIIIHSLSPRSNHPRFLSLLPLPSALSFSVSLYFILPVTSTLSGYPAIVIFRPRTGAQRKPRSAAAWERARCDYIPLCVPRVSEIPARASERARPPLPMVYRGAFPTWLSLYLSYPLTPTTRCICISASFPSRVFHWPSILERSRKWFALLQKRRVV